MSAPPARHMSPLGRCPVRPQVYTTVHTACEHRGTCTHTLALLDAVSLPGWLPPPSSSLETQNLSPMCEEVGSLRMCTWDSASSGALGMRWVAQGDWASKGPVAPSSPTPPAPRCDTIGRAWDRRGPSPDLESAPCG